LPVPAYEDKHPWGDVVSKPQKSPPKEKVERKKDDDFPSLPVPVSGTSVMPNRTKPLMNNTNNNNNTNKPPEEKKSAKLTTNDFPSLPTRKNVSPNSGTPPGMPPEVARVIQLTSTPIGPTPSFPGIGGVGRGKPKNTTNNTNK